MHTPQPTNLTFHWEICWHRKVCEVKHSGWLQHSAGEPDCQDPPARGHYTGFISRGFPSPMEAARERPEFDIKPLSGAPLKIFPQDYLLKSFPQRNTSTRQQGFEITVFPQKSEASHGGASDLLQVDLPAIVW